MSGARFDGRVAIVLGAAGLIGGAIAADLAAHGARVVAVDLAPIGDGLLPAQGGHRGVVGDVTDDATLAAAFGDLLDPPPSLLVNSTIYQHEAPLLERGPADFLRAYEVMTVAGTRWATRMVRGLEGRPGSVVTIASVHAHGGVDGFGPYAAAKAAGLALTRAMAVEWGPSGVRVNAVAPAFVPGTDRHREDTPEQLARRRARFPLGTFPGAADVAAATRFLLSDDAASITGVCLPVDGGLLARLP